MLCHPSVVHQHDHYYHLVYKKQSPPLQVKLSACIHVQMGLSMGQKIGRERGRRPNVCFLNAISKLTQHLKGKSCDEDIWDGICYRQPFKQEYYIQYKTPVNAGEEM